MAKANVSRQALVEAIAALEAQRGSADVRLDRAVETALQALRDKLAAVQSVPSDAQQRDLVVLVADLSGFTAISERMDAEKVRDALNAMWRALDPVVAAYGGRIDQHAGDSLLALFGLPQARQGDAARALLAAQALQAELGLFNERVRDVAEESGGATWAAGWRAPSMRIGVHSGPVYFARAAGSGRVSAVGETVAVARRLERAAPDAQVLVSAAIYRQTHARFQFTAAPPGVIVAAGRPLGEDIYLVVGERPEVPIFSPTPVAGHLTRLIGRGVELDELELALQTTVDTRLPQVVTVMGAAGLGKSRLVAEFEGRARLLSSSLTVLRGSAQPVCPETPYGLIRDLLLRRLSIRPQHSGPLIADRIRRALGALDRPERGRRLSATGHLATTQEVLRRLLHVHAAAELSPDEVQSVIEGVLRAVTVSGPAIVVLEGVHRADKESLVLVERLARSEDPLPVLMVLVAAGGAAPLGGVPGQDDDPFSPVTQLRLPPLSAVEGRLMATDILGPLSPPMRLLDLIVAESGGNPLYIEAFIRLLMERGVIAVGERWRVDMARAESMHLPNGLPGLMAARLENLPDAERLVLRAASVMGWLFWDAALLESQSPLLGDLTAPEVEAALLSLEMKRFFARDATYSFAATQAYAFRREALHDAAYATLTQVERQAEHRRMAHWLIANQRDARLTAWLPVETMVAHHLAAAGQVAEAAVWQRRMASAP